MEAGGREDEPADCSEAIVFDEIPYSYVETGSSSVTGTEPTDAEIKTAAELMLDCCDLATMTLKRLRSQLEQQFGVSFHSAERKVLLRGVLNRFISTNTAAIKYAQLIEEERLEAEVQGAPEEAYKKGGKGFAKPVLLSQELAEFLGAEVLPRTEVTKRMWAYIREHDLQNPKDRRQILLDERLQQLFKRKQLDMFRLTKCLSEMMKSADDLQDSCLAAASEEAHSDEDETEDDVIESKKRSVVKQERHMNAVASASSSADRGSSNINSNSDSNSTGNGRKRSVVDVPTGKGAKLVPDKVDYIRDIAYLKVEGSKKRVKVDMSRLSDEQKKELKPPRVPRKVTQWRVDEQLCQLLDIEPNTSRPQVVSKMWEYIRSNDLQNPQDKRVIRLDDKLRSVFDTDTFTMFSMNKFIAQHIFPVESQT